MGLDLQPFFQLRDDALLPDSRLPGDEHDLSVAGLGALPTAQQEVNLLSAANQRG